MSIQLLTILIIPFFLKGCDSPALEGEEVTITGYLTGTEAEAFQAAFKSFTDETGIIVTYKGYDNFVQEILGKMEAGDSLPDFALWSQPSDVVDAAERGFLSPLTDLDIDLDTYKTNFSSYLVGLGTVDNVIYGGANSANLKSLFWYQPAEFEARGYSVPKTWDELIALADQIVADGMNPFCFGIYSNGASGWSATDWMEDIILRTGGGTETYDKWVNHEIPFNDPVVKNAATLLSQIMHTEGYVVGGTDAIVSTYFGNAQDPMFEKDANGNPGCFMHKQASFITDFWPVVEKARAGSVTTVFPFPSIDSSLPKAALGGADMWGAFNDRDATKAVAKFMLSAEFFNDIAIRDSNTRLSAHSGFNTSLYSQSINKIMGDTIAAALSANSFRFDASDLMPPEVGTGSFWKEMMNLAVEGPGYIDTALDNIEKSWP